jgi:hypothetical protein
MCYRHNLTGPRDGPRATWAEGNYRNGLQIGFCGEQVKGRDGHVFSKDSLNIES